MKIINKEIEENKISNYIIKNSTKSFYIKNKDIVGISSHSKKKFTSHGITNHPFINAIFASWNNHYKLSLKPIHFWILILQAVSKHVNSGNNAEDLRKEYVLHKEKKELVIRCDDFTLDNNGKDNDWSNFVDKIILEVENNTVCSTMDTFLTDFSTTNRVEEIASKMCVMDVCKSYFEYTCLTLCGFPEINLDGTLEDWKSLKDKTINLLNSNLLKKEFSDQWRECLIPILDNIYTSALNASMEKTTDDDLIFWDGMIKLYDPDNGMSGSVSYLNGWFNVFFPQIEVDSKFNYYCTPYEIDHNYKNFTPRKLLNKSNPFKGGSPIHSFQNGFCQTPVLWIYYDQKFQLNFKSGFVGVTVDKKDNIISPEIGWYITK